MMIQGFQHAFQVSHLIGRRLTSSAVPEQYAFSLKLGKFCHDSRDNWYFIQFHKPLVKRCELNILEKEFCSERGFVYA